MNRVVVTGVGVVSPVGNTRDEYWSALVEGRSGIGPIENIPTERLVCKIAAEVRNFDPKAHLDSKQLGLMDRFAVFAVLAARAAVKDSGLEIDEETALDTATIIGTGVGGQNTIDDSYLRLYGQNSSKVHPFTVPRLMPNAAASHVTMDLKLRGPTFSIVSACASGTHAIGTAFHMVRSGQAPLALAGGSEACITVGGVKTWEALRVLATEACRPFSKGRNGLVLGEGAAMLVLERRDSAIARGATIYCEITGFGMTADAGDITSPDAFGAGRAIKAALRDAKLDPSGIDYVNAHGTGTTINDKTETQVLKDVFGEHARKLAISSNKAVLGHSLGAAGALEAVATAMTLREQIAPPTANYLEPDPECDLDVVPNVARKMPIRAAISNSFAFGGLNAVLAFAKH
ncbi:MAG: 3-oxoacyl-ACP synthase [Xanthobacteraceae bacterium]|jgi:nodulation protein E|nr:3-oxoacyl-ACP synthase [Xanthobacteraceae bacterium]